ncbi:MAG: glycogen-binding domain-containing protein [Gammaproteobacteria bacterium]|nr:glycogen-binding domain-containing protein [Gammaproteobacteria bacterium]
MTKLGATPDSKHSRAGLWCYFILSLLALKTAKKPIETGISVQKIRKVMVDSPPNSPVAKYFSDLADELIMRNHRVQDMVQANISWLLSHAASTEKKPTKLASYNRERPAEKSGNVQKVVLSFQNHQQRDIRIAGEFNQWIADKDVQTIIEDDIIYKVFYVTPGDYPYRLIVNGRWRNDPTNPRQTLSTLGIHNSLLHVTTNDPPHRHM